MKYLKTYEDYQQFEKTPELALYLLKIKNNVEKYYTNEMAADCLERNFWDVVDKDQFDEFLEEDFDEDWSDIADNPYEYMENFYRNYHSGELEDELIRDIQDSCIETWGDDDYNEYWEEMEDWLTGYIHDKIEWTQDDEGSTEMYNWTKSDEFQHYTQGDKMGLL